MKTRLLFAILLFPLLSTAQEKTRAIVYRSEKDHQNGNGVLCRDYAGTTNVGFKHYAHFAQEKKMLRLKWEELWGFEWRGDLFRCGPYDLPVRLVEEGPICFWQAGSIYISKGLHGELIPVVHADRHGGPAERKKVKDYVRFQRSEPALDRLCQCIDSSNDRMLVRRCVEEYNEGGLVDLSPAADPSIR